MTDPAGTTRPTLGTPSCSPECPSMKLCNQALQRRMNCHCDIPFPIYGLGILHFAIPFYTCLRYFDNVICHM